MNTAISTMAGEAISSFPLSDSMVPMVTHRVRTLVMGILNITHLFGVAAVRDNKKIEVVDGPDPEKIKKMMDVIPVIGIMLSSVVSSDLEAISVLLNMTLNLVEAIGIPHAQVKEQLKMLIDHMELVPMGPGKGDGN